MGIELITILMFGCFFALLALGVPLAWNMGVVGIVFSLIIGGYDFLPVSLYRLWTVSASFGLMAIPLFMFMASLLQYAGLADDLFHAIHLWMGPINGGVAIATVIVCAIMGAMLGSTGSGIIIMGLIALPYMFSHGYDKRLTLGTIMSGGGLGVLIPPSIMFILYGSLSGESIGKLLIGGVGPGILLAVLYSIYISIRCYLNPKMGPPLPNEEREIPFRAKLALIKNLILPGLLILAIIGSIFGGLATPTEAAGVGVVGAMICCAVRGKLTLANLKSGCFVTMKVIGLMWWLVFGSSIFVGVYTLAGGAEFIKDILLALPLGRWGVLIVINLILILLGMVIDLIGICILVIPITTPVIAALGFDPLWFAVLFNINLQIGYLSPPFGTSMFYLKGITPPEVTMSDIISSVWPWMGLQLLGLIICMLYPPIVTWLPGMMFGK
jgi:tripartite ATP-independent transporter DctM subunit